MEMETGRPHQKGLMLHGIIVLPPQEPTQQGAMDPLAVDITVDCFGEVCIRFSHLPDRERDEALFPADARKSELAGHLVADPVY
jgi:hypothetical protein